MNLHTAARLAPGTRPFPVRSRADALALERRISHITQQIESAIGQDILPRLADRRLAPDQSELDRLVAQAIAGDTDAIRAAVRDRCRSGEDSLQGCLALLTPLARRLGTWWEEDRCGFVEVTLGLVALQQVMRELAPRLTAARPGPLRRSVLMLPVPGEQHRFGIAMLAEFFRAAGWHVCQDGGETARALARRVAGEWFGIVALSCGSTERLGELPALVAAIRAHARNPDIAVMVGGAAFLDGQGSVRHASVRPTGADAAAADAAEALSRAEELVALMAAHP